MLFIYLFYIQLYNRMPKARLHEDESFEGAPSSKYSRVTEHTKDKLCYLVQATSVKVSSAAKILKLNLSTAKMIMKKFFELSQEEREKALLRGAKSKKEKPEQETRPKKITRKSKKSVGNCRINGVSAQRQESQEIKCEVKVQELIDGQQIVDSMGGMKDKERRIQGEAWKGAVKMQQEYIYTFYPVYVKWENCSKEEN